MHKIILTALFMSFTLLNAYSYDYIKENQKIYYNPQNGSWATEGQTSEDLLLINKSFIGSGGFQEYYLWDGELAIGPETNVGFISRGKFIAINSQDLKFFKYTYKNNKFTPIPLNEDEIQKLYPEYQIIKISEFENNTITLNKYFFSKKKVLLLNDTDQSFYKYTYKPKVNPSFVKPFIEISHAGKIVFSHYGDDTPESPALKIFVKNKFKK